MPAMPIRLWLRTGATTALVDFCFASALSVYGYHSTFARLWQGVASVPFGAGVIGAGERWTLAGIALHVLVAFTWSAVFLLLIARSPRLRRAVTSPWGVLAVAALYGPAIWLFMSLVLIPLFTHRAPAFTVRWLIQLAGHVVFVGLPIVWTASRPLRPGGSSL